VLYASSPHRYNFYSALNTSLPLIFKGNHCLTLHHYFLKEIHRLTLHSRYFLKYLCPPLLVAEETQSDADLLLAGGEQNSLVDQRLNFSRLQLAGEEKSSADLLSDGRGM
jgi:hypothetical protein